MKCNCCKEHVYWFDYIIFFGVCPDCYVIMRKMKEEVKKVERRKESMIKMKQMELKRKLVLEYNKRKQ